MRLRNALAYVRLHKVQLGVLVVVAVGVAERYVPGFPADDVLRVGAALLGMA